MWSIDADGTNKKQVVNNEAVNFESCSFPNSNRIIFSPNLNDPKRRDSDLYAINIDATVLERITYFNGFDGFPMFSPDGNSVCL